jgi:hypothetical protein
MMAAYNPHRLPPGVYQVFNVIGNTVLDLVGHECKYVYGPYIIESRFPIHNSTHYPGHVAHDGQNQKVDHHLFPVGLFIPISPSSGSLHH